MPQSPEEAFRLHETIKGTLNSILSFAKTFEQAREQVCFRVK